MGQFGVESSFSTYSWAVMQGGGGESAALPLYFNRICIAARLASWAHVKQTQLPLVVLYQVALGFSLP
jgi:hypothetical protein